RTGEADDPGVAAVRGESGGDGGQAVVAVLDQAHQPGHRPRITRPGGHDERVDVPRAPYRRHVAGTVTISASPWPPPPHSAAAPTPPPRRRSSSARVSRSRAPDMPIGCPSAIAPPFTLTISGEMPRSRMD